MIRSWKLHQTCDTNRSYLKLRMGGGKMSAASSVHLDEESHSDRLARKARDSPFLVVGITGLIAACSYGVYAYKNRGKMSTSVYLMQLRVGAQGAVVGALTLGVAYNLVKEYIIPSLYKKND